MKKNTVKLNENTLRKIIAENVKKVLKEDDFKLSDDIINLDIKFRDFTEKIGKITKIDKQYCSYFNLQGKTFFASLIKVGQIGGYDENGEFISDYIGDDFSNYTEFMIFLLEGKKRKEVYCKRNIEFSEESFRKLVNNFIIRNNSMKESKQSIKINTSQLKKIIAENVKKVLKESFDNFDNDIFMTAHDIIQNGIYEIVEKHSVTPTVAAQELTKVLKTYDADDLYDDGDYHYEDGY